MKKWLVFLLFLLSAVFSGAVYPPLPVDILDPGENKIGKAEIHSNYIVLYDRGQKKLGAIGVVMVEGRQRLFLINSANERKLVGWAENHRIFSPDGKLAGFYHWTAIWSYVYDKDLKKRGQARCLAYQGLCAAGVAGYLLGLF